MKASWVFVVGGKIQKFLRVSIWIQRFQVKPVGVAAQERTCECSEFRWASLLLLAATFKVEQAFILEQLGMQVKNKVHQAQLWPPRGALGGQLALLLNDLHRTIQRLQQQIWG